MMLCNMKCMSLNPNADKANLAVRTSWYLDIKQHRKKKILVNLCCCFSRYITRLLNKKGLLLDQWPSTNYHIIRCRFFMPLCFLSTDYG